MFKALFGRKSQEKDAHALYGAVVARARDPEFYINFGVPDTFDGRFEILAMHLFLLHARLQNEDKYARDVSQRVFDNFIDDMDAALREAAVGDQTVPKRIGKMTRVFYGRSGVYASALSGNDAERDLKTVILRNLFPEGGSNGKELALARYMVETNTHLSKSTVRDIIDKYELFNQPFSGIK